MKLKSQVLLEVIIGLVVFVLVSILIFILFTSVSKALRYSEDSLIIYNQTNNYSFILLGIARENFSNIDILEENVDYYLEPTTTGYIIKEGKQLIPYKSENYFVWFKVVNKMLNGDLSQKLIHIFVQTPSMVKKSPLIVTNLKEGVIFQDFWLESTSSIIWIPFSTSIIYYSTKSENININGEIYLP